MSTSEDRTAARAAIISAIEATAKRAADVADSVPAESMANYGAAVQSFAQALDLLKGAAPPREGRGAVLA